MNRATLLASFSAAALGGALTQASRAADPLRVMTTPIDPGAEPYYAQDLGFFRDAGLDATVLSVASGAVVVNSVVAGSAEIGTANLTSLAIAFNHGIPITVVAPCAFYDSKTPTPLLLVSKNSSIRSASDLNGKTVGVAGLGTVVEWAPRIWMDKNGGDSKTLHFVEMNMPLMGDALSAGRVDASVVAEPFLSQDRSQTRVLAQVYDAIAPRFSISSFFSMTSWARANADIVARFQSVIARTAAWANTHHDQSAEILARHSKIKPEIAKNMVRIGFEERLNAKMMQPLIDLVAHYGGIDAAFPADQLIFKP